MDTLKAEKRSMETKAKRLRREGYVTGNVFGHDIEGSIPVKIAKNDAENILKKKKKGSQIMLEVEGTQYDVLIKEVDLSGLKAGDVVKVKDLAIAADKDVVLVTDPEAVVVTVTVPHNAPIPETDAEEAEEAEK